MNPVFRVRADSRFEWICNDTKEGKEWEQKTSFKKLMNWRFYISTWCSDLDWSMDSKRITSDIKFALALFTP